MIETQVLIAMLIIIIIITAIVVVRYKLLRQSPDLYLEIIIDHIKIKGVIHMIQLTTTQQVTGQVKPKNRLGGDAPVEPGSVIIQSSDSSVLAVVQDPDDETKFRLVAKKAGVVQIDVVADADLGEGVTAINTFAGIEVIPAGAVGFGIDFGSPEEQPGEETPKAPGEPPTETA